MKMKEIKYNFPYYNSGKATYYQWFSLIVVFQEEPSDKEKEKIKNNAPLPFGEIYFEEEYMTALNDGNIHVEISKAYKTEDGKYMENEFEEWVEFVAADSQVEAFNLDIERWLNEAHQISPIYFVFKNDDELHGTKITEYSSWHQWSLQQYKTILPYFETEINNGYDYYDFSEKANVIQKILTKVEDISNLEEKHINFLYPGKLEFKAFEKDNIKPLQSITNNNYAEKVIKLFNKKLKKRHSAYINKYAGVFLSFETLVNKGTFETLNVILFKYFDDIDSTIFKKIAANLTSTNIANSFAEKGFKLVYEEKYKKAVKLFTKLLMASAEPSVESGFYTNVLWVLQNDNTGIPVNKGLNQLALQKCLPKGKEYPAIYFNACCLYVEMEDHEKAYKMIEIALANYFDAQTMLQQTINEPMFKVFRKKTAVIHLLENYKPEPKTNPEPRLISYSIAFHLYDITTIKNNLGHTTNFTTIILINGHVETLGEFTDIYNHLLPEIEKIKTNRRPLVLVNGNLTAKSIGVYGDEYIVVMGKIICDNINQKDIIEVGETNFEYVPLTAKRHHE